jgi:hypothetical protein
MLIFIAGAVGCLTVVYMVIKRKGREEVINKSRKEALQDVQAVKKRDIEHANDSIDDIDKQLLKNARD